MLSKWLIGAGVVEALARGTEWRSLLTSSVADRVARGSSALGVFDAVRRRDCAGRASSTPTLTRDLHRAKTPLAIYLGSSRSRSRNVPDPGRYALFWSPQGIRAAQWSPVTTVEASAAFGPRGVLDRRTGLISRPAIEDEPASTGREHAAVTR